MNSRIKNILIISFLLEFLTLSCPQFPVLADQPASQAVSFFVDSKMDQYGREELKAVLKNTSQHAYFFVDQDW